MIGKNLAHYEITGLLGKGGMGEVYRARDTNLGRDVALKILPEELARDPERLARFDHEARTVAGLNHPNIVHIYSIEEDAGQRFLTMELVEGQELARLIESGGMALDRVLEVGISVSDALAAAHAKGVVHRDLKPANVMVSTDGRVKVLDFGLAKLATRPEDPATDRTEALGLTQQGFALGTIPYMSPEQLRGHELDARSDLFSLGIVLHEISTGEHPFAGDTTADLTSSILKDEPRPIGEIRPGLPERIERVVRQCMAKEPGQRPASAEAVGRELREIRRQIDSGTLPSSPDRRAGGKRPVLAVLAILLPLLVVFGWWAGRDGDSGSNGASGRPIVAVLPFENLGSGEEEYFATGITDEITSRLALIEGLGVISRTSARVYANSEKSTQEVARELGADYVLEGAIRWDKSREPGRVRISPRLIRVEDDTYLWTDNYEREVTEIFALQAMIASRIADALDVTLLAPVREALDTRPTESMEAYQAYLQGMRHLEAPGFSQESFQLGIQMFERAVAADPDFAVAHARLSSLHSRLYHYGYDRSDARRLAALESAERALALQPDLAAGRLSLGYYYYWCVQDYERALEELEAAQRLEPNNTRIWLATAYVHRRRGDLERAAELLERVHALNPLDPNVETALGETYSTLRRYAEAEPPLRRALALAPDDPYPCTELALVYLRWRADTSSARTTLKELPAVENAESYRVRMLVELFDRRFDRALEILDEFGGEAFESAAFYLPVDLWRGLILRGAGRESAAEAAFQRARVQLEPRLAANDQDHRTHAALGLALAGLGLREEAIGHGERAVELYPMSRDALAAPMQVIHLALVHALLGDEDAAVELLAQALSIPSTISFAWVDASPLWDGIRDAPDYAELGGPR